MNVKETFEFIGVQFATHAINQYTNFGVCRAVSQLQKDGLISLVTSEEGYRLIREWRQRNPDFFHGPCRDYIAPHRGDPEWTAQADDLRVRMCREIVEQIKEMADKPAQEPVEPAETPKQEQTPNQKHSIDVVADGQLYDTIDYLTKWWNYTESLVWANVVAKRAFSTGNYQKVEVIQNTQEILNVYSK